MSKTREDLHGRLYIVSVYCVRCWTLSTMLDLCLTDIINHIRPLNTNLKRKENIGWLCTENGVITAKYI